MNYRELLELAANAVVGGAVKWMGGKIHLIRDPGDGKGGRLSPPWDPLNDDGDALRLAVELRIDIRQFPTEVEAQYYLQDGRPRGYAEEDARQDRLAATRRAIVRAAAEIGAHHAT